MRGSSRAAILAAVMTAGIGAGPGAPPDDLVAADNRLAPLIERRTRKANA